MFARDTVAPAVNGSVPAPRRRRRCRTARLATSSRTGRQVRSARRAVGVLVEQRWRAASRICPTVSVPVAGPDQAASTVSACRRVAARAAGAARWSPGRRPRARPSVSWRTSTPDARAGGRAAPRRRWPPGSPSTGPVGDLAAERLLDLVRPVLRCSTGVAARSGAAQVQPAEARRASMPCSSNHASQASYRAGVVGAAVHAGVLEPQLDVLRRVGDLALHDPGVAAAARQPAADPLLPGSPRRCTQLASTWHQPPAVRCAGACVDDPARPPRRRAARSRGRPAARRWPARPRTAGW